MKLKYQKYGTKCAITDFAILLGGYVSSNHDISEENDRKDCSTVWWTKSFFSTNSAIAVREDGIRTQYDVKIRYGGARPVVSFSAISSILSNRVRDINGLKEIEYGEYLQTVVDENDALELETAYHMGNLKATGKEYTTDFVALYDLAHPSMERTHIEYEYHGNKYIRFVLENQDGRKIQSKNIYWLRVEPIIWFVEEKNNILISKKVLFSGIQFQNQKDSNVDFDKTDIKQFMDHYFSKDIISDREND